MPFARPDGRGRARALIARHEDLRKPLWQVSSAGHVLFEKASLLESLKTQAATRASKGRQRGQTGRVLFFKACLVISSSPFPFVPAICRTIFSAVLWLTKKNGSGGTSVARSSTYETAFMNSARDRLFQLHYIIIIHYF
jgi:hypothetical protein